METSTDRSILRVSELNREVRLLLERGFPLVWVQGEISNLTKPASGHWYFSLKDAQAQVRCAMFKPRNSYLAFSPENGQEVLARARIGLYEPRGEFQLIVEHLEPAGTGALQRQFDAIKSRLAAEGLFDAARKRPLPALPRCIGVVTSPSGAAIHDILTVLRRRFPAIPVMLYPTSVQGAAAPAEISAAIGLASKRHECDVLIVGRGGGSLEDLWAFNDETVARAIAASAIPIVSAVGHEIDVTIADFAADVRAATPSAAAELVAPDSARFLAQLARDLQRLRDASLRRIKEKSQRLQWVSARLRHPRQHIQQQSQRADELTIRLHRAMAQFLRNKSHSQQHAHAQLMRHAPILNIQQLMRRSDGLANRLTNAQLSLIVNRRQRWVAASSALDAVSPLSTLARGYAIVRRGTNGEIIKSSQDISVGEKIDIQLHRGRVVACVEDTPDV